MPLPKFQSPDQAMVLMQSNWASILDPIIKSPLINGIFFTDVVLVNGSNVINHKLSRNQQGWIITDQNASAEIYRSAPLNDKTLTLTSSSGVTVSIYVF